MNAMRICSVLLCATSVLALAGPTGAQHAGNNQAAGPSGPGLAQLFTQGQQRGWRFGWDGDAAAGARTIPPAPTGEGAHWLVAFDAQGEPAAWHRFSVGTYSEVEAILEHRAKTPHRQQAGVQQARLTLAIDDRPPRGAFRLEDGSMPGGQPVVVSPGARVTAVAIDNSGVRDFRTGTTTDGARPDAGWMPGPGIHYIAGEGTDQLGNAGAVIFPALLVDGQGPEVRLRNLDAGEGAPGDVFNGRTTRFQLEASDPSGVVMLKLAEQEDPPVIPAQPAQLLTLSARKGPIGWVARDALGHTSSGAFDLRKDRRGPSAAVYRGDEVLDRARFGQGERGIELRATDSEAGVAEACAESRAWEGCRALPMTLDALPVGKHRLKVRASDLLGNRSRTTVRVEVQP